jgi:hypothetical protein
VNQFCKLPAWLRITVAVGFLIAAVVIGIRGRPSAILAVASLALLASGAWRLSRLRVLMLLLIMIPLLIGFLLAGFDWHHPFLARYSAGLFSVIAVLIFMDAVRIEEWIEVLHKNSARLHLENVTPIVIGTAVGIISLSAGIQEQRACRKLAGVYRWRAKSQISVFLDSMSLPFYGAVESHEFIDEALHRWSSRRQGQEETGWANAESELRAFSDLSFGNSIFTARLIDVYDFPYYTHVLQTLSTSTPLPEPWEKALTRVVKGSTALQVNGPSEGLTRRLLRAGLRLTVVERVPAFREDLCSVQREYGSSLIIAAGSSFGNLHGGFDCTLFYQNAFLETLNEMETGVLLKKLFALSKPEAQVFFTYPALETVAAEGIIFTGNLAGIGDICYQYAGYERAGEMAKARLAYTVKQERDSYCVRVPVKFKAPDLSSLLLAAEEAGFTHKTSPMPQAAGFFLKDQIFIELGKRR